MYDLVTMYEHMDQHKYKIWLVGGISIIFIWIWFGSALRVSTRDKFYSTPLFIDLFWFAHDFSEVLRFKQWFFVYDAWFPKLLTIQFMGTVTFEIFYLRQVIRYGRKELAPSLSQGAWTALIIGAVVFTYVIWEIMRLIYQDPGYIWGTAMTLVLYPPFAIGMTLRRGTRAGQTSNIWIGFLGCCVFWWGSSIAWFGGPCQTPGYIALGVLSIIGGIVMLWLLNKMPKAGEAPLKNWGDLRGRPDSATVTA